MDKPVSFDVNHSNLKSGVYVSRVDHVGTTRLTTLDIRLFSREDIQYVDDALNPVLGIVPIWFTAAYKNNALSSWVSGLHSLEHALAYVLRNGSGLFFTSCDSLVYVGPGGCLSMFYLVIAEDNSLPAYVTEVAKNGKEVRYPSNTAQTLIKDAFRAAYDLLSESTTVPGSGIAQCGNPVLHSKEAAMFIIKYFLDRSVFWETAYPEAE